MNVNFNEKTAIAKRLAVQIINPFNKKNLSACKTKTTETNSMPQQS